MLMIVSPAAGNQSPTRTQAATVALAAAEQRDADQVELDDLSAAVILANIADADTQIAGGVEPSSDRRRQLARDRRLLREGQGSMDPARQADRDDIDRTGQD
jgi:hypothetical protein